MCIRDSKDTVPDPIVRTPDAMNGEERNAVKASIIGHGVQHSKKSGDKVILRISIRKTIGNPIRNTLCATRNCNVDAMRSGKPLGHLLPVSYTHLRAHETVLD